jgi:hypothetical protein
MKKELALIIGAAVIVLLIYPLTWFTYVGSNWLVILMLPLLALILYSIFHAVNLLHNKMRKKAIIFVSLFVVTVVVSFQLVLLLIRSTILFVA